MKFLRLMTSSIFLILATLGMFTLFLLVQHLRIAADFGDSEVISHLEKTVQVDIDSSGTIHIAADSEHDAIVASGYCAAATNLWEMEQLRMAASGRLAEAYGIKYLDADLVNRSLGFDSLSTAIFRRLPTNTRDWLDKYVSGVNSFIQSERYNADIRFQLHNIEPQQWKSSDPVLLQRFIAWHADGGWRIAYLKAHLQTVLPPFQLASLSEDNAGLSAIDRIPALDKFWQVHRQLREFFGQFRIPAVATYMIDLNRLNRGANILAANGWTAELPINRQKIHIISPEMEVAGLSIPGIPGIQQGRGRDSAWGWFWLSNQSFAFRKARLSQDLSQLFFDSLEVNVAVDRLRIQVLGNRPVNWVRHSTATGVVLNPSVQQEYRSDTWWMFWAGLFYSDEFTLLRKLMTETGRENLSAHLQRTAYPARLVLYDADHETGLAAVQSTNINREADWDLLSDKAEISLAPRKAWVFPPYLELPAGHPITGDDGIERQTYLQEWTARNLFSAALSSKSITAGNNLPIGDLPDKLFSWLRLVNDDAMNTVHPQAEEVLFLLRQWQDEPSDNPVANLVLTVWKTQILELLLMDHLDPEWQLRLSETPQFFVPWLRRLYKGKDDSSVGSELIGMSGTDQILTEAFTRTLRLLNKSIGPDIADWDLKSLLNSGIKRPLENLLIYEMTSGLASSPIRRNKKSDQRINNLPEGPWEIGSWSNWGGFRESGLKILRRRSVKQSEMRGALSPFLHFSQDNKFQSLRFATPVTGVFRIYLKP